MERQRPLLVLAAAFGFTGVAAGAFGAHALRDILDPAGPFETAARYQMYHALALFGVALAVGRSPSRLWTVSGALFTVGIIVFSGSLYVLSISGIRWLGAITPLGGVAFLAGWACLAWAAIRS